MAAMSFLSRPVASLRGCPAKNLSSGRSVLRGLSVRPLSPMNPTISTRAEPNEGVDHDPPSKDSVQGEEEGFVNPEPIQGTSTKDGRPREHFGVGHAARVAAGKKGGEISAERPPEARKEAARKAARTRAERYGDTLHVSDPEQDDLKGVDTHLKPTEAGKRVSGADAA